VHTPYMTWSTRYDAVTMHSFRLIVNILFELYMSLKKMSSCVEFSDKNKFFLKHPYLL